MKKRILEFKEFVNKNINEHDIVYLLERVDDLLKGTHGTVVYVNDNGEEFVVEFNLEGKSNIIKTLPLEKITNKTNEITK